MARWTVVKYNFRTVDTDQLHILEFLVSKNGHTISERLVEKMANKILHQLSLETDDIETPTFDFGNLKVNDFLDDIRKLMLVEFPKAKGMRVQLWFDRDDYVAFWDDGLD